MESVTYHPGQKTAESNSLPTQPQITALAEFYKVLGDKTRMRILFTLFQGALSVCAITERLSMTQSAVSHQLRILKDAKLVTFQREGKFVSYALADDHVKTIIIQGYTHICEESANE